jgi:hypothetical protein
MSPTTDGGYVKELEVIYFILFYCCAGWGIYCGIYKSYYNV